jgi:hypothetical protein
MNTLAPARGATRVLPENLEDLARTAILPEVARVARAIVLGAGKERLRVDANMPVASVYQTPLRHTATHCESVPPSRPSNPSSRWSDPRSLCARKIVPTRPTARFCCGRAGACPFARLVSQSICMASYRDLLQAAALPIEWSTGDTETMPLAPLACSSIPHTWVHTTQAEPSPWHTPTTWGLDGFNSHVPYVADLAQLFFRLCRLPTLCV